MLVSVLFRVGVSVWGENTHILFGQQTILLYN